MHHQGPISGITIVDLSKVLAGPFATMICADLGARVIKVEPPGNGDDSRHFPPFIKGVSAYFASINRGKESIALNLKQEKDRAIFEKLLERADVIVENYRPGVMERLGYGWEELHKKYPRLIYAASSGFGHSGPYSQRAAYDMVVQGMGGIMSITGHPHSPPTRVGTSIGDIIAALYTVIGIEGALYRRTISGEGMKVDVAMLDGQVSILENAMARYFATGEVPTPLGARHPSIAPFEVYKTLDSHLVVAAGNDSLFEKLAAAMERPDLVANSLFATNPERVANLEHLNNELEPILITKTTAQWREILDKAGVPCGPINNVKNIIEDPQVLSRTMIIETDDPVAGPITMAGNPVKLSAYKDPKKRPPAPQLDENRERILDELGVKA
ncbi:MAG: CoA transferase [Candidatus Eremiobacteraeota bacterium]|nr:CoA transferase [Candidatus Eremiobacteraeota bacterium]